MGNHHHILDSVLPILGKKMSQSCSIYLFGSQLLGMAHEDSDTDLLILTPKPLDKFIREKIQAELLERSIQAVIISFKSFDHDRNLTCVEAAPYETASRYGIKIHGTKEVFPLMSDEDLINAMLICSIAYSASPQLILKELFRSTLILWYLENKLSLSDIYSLGHFQHWLLRQGPSTLEGDELWSYIDKSGLALRWLDSNLAEILGTHEIEAWSSSLRARIKKFYYRLNSLNFRGISSESYPAQENSILFHGVQWTEDLYGNKTMKDQGVRTIINIIKLK